MKLWPATWWPHKPQAALDTAPAAKSAPAAEPSPAGFFSTALTVEPNRLAEACRAVIDKRGIPVRPKGYVSRQADGSMAMDSFGDSDFAGQFGMAQSQISPLLGAWYVSQGFIGYQMCAILAQQWLIDKACTQAPKDAARNGYKLTVNDGTEVDEAMLTRIHHADKRMKLNQNLVEFSRFNRVFGIRIAVFDVRSADPYYYEKPFNIDGVAPGSYRGISQVDPYWMTPELDWDAAANPASKHFYEPTYWTISGRRYHRSHLVVIRGPEVPDILKPTYLYGGLSLTQRIYERVYAAERTANEAPQLALSKRTTVIKTDTSAAMANQDLFEQRMRVFTELRDNFGVMTIGEKEDPIQFETSLADLDAVIMTQYQIVAAIASTPATKLLGTSPKGFNATGEYDEASYHEELESIQTHEMEPLLTRHYLLLMKSEISPDAPFRVDVSWNALDAITGKEEAEIQESKARTAQIYSELGAVDSGDVRRKISQDPDSGYNGLSTDLPPGSTEPTGMVETPLEETPASDAETAAINSSVQNLTGKQYQGIARILRNHRKGNLSPEQAGMMLQAGFGLNPDQCATLLGGAVDA